MNAPSESKGSRSQRRSGPVTNRTWTALTTGALLVLGVDGLVTLLTTGRVKWTNVVALVLGVTSFIDLVLRWSDI